MLTNLWRWTAWSIYLHAPDWTGVDLWFSPTDRTARLGIRRRLIGPPIPYWWIDQIARAERVTDDAN